MKPFFKPQADTQANQPDLAFQGEALEPTTQKQPSVEKPKRNIPSPKILVTAVIIVITLLAFGLITYLLMAQNKAQVINSYEECVAAGYPIMESYPEQCAANGITFTRELTDEEEEKLNPDLVSDWEIVTSNTNPEFNEVRNLKFDYSFEIPQEWVIKFDQNGWMNIYLNEDDSNYIQKEIGDDVASVSIGRSVSEYQNADELYLFNIKAKEEGTKQSSGVISDRFNYDLIALSGKKVMQTEGCYDGCGKSISFVLDDYIHHIQYHKLNINDELEVKSLQIYDQILSTFNFTE